MIVSNESSWVCIPHFLSFHLRLPVVSLAYLPEGETLPALWAYLETLTSVLWTLLGYVSDPPQQTDPF